MYIRTEDGVYLVDEERETYFIKLSKNGFENYVPREKVIKTADTIDELCDGFYNDILGDGYFNFDSLYIYNDFESFKDDWLGYRTHDNWEGDGYGFIKTPKGLIYVVKMNDKGELELI